MTRYKAALIIGWTIIVVLVLAFISRNNPPRFYGTLGGGAVMAVLIAFSLWKNRGRDA